jgi:hypothetical protein
MYSFLFYLHILSVTVQRIYSTVERHSHRGGEEDRPPPPFEEVNPAVMLMGSPDKLQLQLQLQQEYQQQLLLMTQCIEMFCVLGRRVVSEHVMVAHVT